MNIVDVIRNQVSSEQMNQLASLLGTTDETTRTAVNAAVPSLLGAISRLVSSNGVARVVNALLRFAPGSADSRSTGNATDQVRQGEDVLNSLFGNETFTAMSGALSKFGGVGQDGMRKMLGYLAPIVLGGLAAQAGTGGRRIDSQGVTGFFNEQRSNVENAMPMGLSLNEVFPASASSTTEDGGSTARWFVPVAAVAALAVAAVFYFNQNSPTLNVPANSNEMRTSVLDACKSMTTQLDRIRDVDTAQAAMPELKKLATRFTTLKTAADKLPTSDLDKVKETIETNVNKVDEQLARLTWLPGVSDKVQPVVHEIMDTMGAMCGHKPDTRISTVSADLSQVFASLTQTMSGVTDPTTATEALPKFKEIEDRLDQARQAMERLPESRRDTLSSVMRPAMDQLRQTVEQMLSRNGVGEKVKPTVDAIMTKINSIAG